MKSVVVPVRVSEEERSKMVEMALILGFTRQDGEANLSEYLREIHRLAVRMYERGLVKTSERLEVASFAQEYSPAKRSSK